MTSAESKLAVGKALQIMGLFRELNQDMPIGEVVSFLTIAAAETQSGEGLTVTELGQRGEFSLASASRYMRSLSSKNRQGGAGHEVVTDARDPLDDRRKVLRISPKGYGIIANIRKILES